MAKRSYNKGFFSTQFYFISSKFSSPSSVCPHGRFLSITNSDMSRFSIGKSTTLYQTKLLHIVFFLEILLSFESLQTQCHNFRCFVDQHLFLRKNKIFASGAIPSIIFSKDFRFFKKLKTILKRSLTLTGFYI